MKKRKVKITQLPQAKEGGSMKTFGAQTPPHDATASPTSGSYHGGNTPEIKVNDTLKPTSLENATLEAELGETVITNLQGEGIPEFYKILGKPHSKGGTPLNLPPHSFIFSKDKALAIKDEEIQKAFGKPFKKKGYTPAELSLSYNINKYREILVNPSSDKKSRETAEKMIKNYNLKLGKLALVQESMKGFENGVPAVAQGYMEHMGIQPADLLGTTNMPQAPLPQMKRGGQLKRFQPGGVQSVEDAKRNLYSNFDIIQKDRLEENLLTQKPFWDINLGVATNLGRQMTEEPALYRNLAEKTSLEEVATTSEPTKGFTPFNSVGVDALDQQTPVQFPTESEYAKYGGVQGKRKVKIVELPKADIGRNLRPNKSRITPVYDAQTGEVVYVDQNGLPVQMPQATQQTRTPRYDVPEDANVYSEEQYANDPSIAQEGDYVMVNGVPKRVSAKKLPDYGDKYKDESLGLSTQFQNAYGLLKDKIESSPKLKQAMIDQYRERVKTLKPGNNLSREDIVYMQNLKPDEIIKNFYDMELKNYRVADAAQSLTGEDKAYWDRTAGQGKLGEFMKSIGEEIPDSKMTSAFQNTYEGLKKLAESGEFDEELKGLNVEGLGRADEKTGLHENISPIDGWYGNTTAGQVVLPVETENTFEDVAELPEEEMPAGTPLPNVQRPGAEWWLQDKLNLGQATYDYLTEKKYPQWNAPLLYSEATPTFADFRGSAARIGSLASGMGAGLSTFAGPQSYNSRMSDISRKMTEGILKTQEAEQKKNVDVANQFSARNMIARNQYQLQKTNLGNKAYENNITNDQEYDNKKRALKWNMHNMGISGITDAAKTQSMNIMRDNYFVDPSSGGLTYFVGTPGQIKPTSSPTQPLDAIAAIKGQYGDMTWKDAADIYKTTKGIPEYPMGVDPRSAMPYYPGAYPGAQRT